MIYLININCVSKLKLVSNTQSIIKKVYQIATAVSDGCNAALNVKMDITNEK